MRVYTEDYAPKSKRLRRIYERSFELGGGGNLSWRAAMREGGERKAAALLDAVFRAMYHVREDLPDVREEDLYTCGVELISADLSAGWKQSKSMYIHGQIVRGLLRAYERPDALIPIESLDEAVEAGLDAQDLSGSAMGNGLKEAQDHLEAVLETLSFREREVIKLRYGLGDGEERTYKKIGEIFKVSNNRIMQICNKAMYRLQNPLRIGQLMELQAYAAAFGSSVSSLAHAMRTYETKALPLERELELTRQQKKAERVLDRLEEKWGADKAREVYQLFDGDPFGFIAYLRSQGVFPDRKGIKRVMAGFSRDDREKLSVDVSFEAKVEQVFSEDPHVAEILQRLTDAERLAYSDALYHKVSDLVFPLFVQDPARVRRKIDRLQKQKRSAVLGRVSEYFKSVDDLEIPNMKTKLRAYQKADVFFMENNPHVLYANPMGLGKSATILASYAHSGAERLLVIAPTSAAVGVWPQEIVKHFAEPPSFAVVRGRDAAQQVRDKGNTKILIVTYSSLAYCLDELVKQRFDIIASDESHMVTNPDSQRYQNFSRLHAPRKILSSGTPFKNSRSELWAPLRWLAPERFECSQEDFNEVYSHSDGAHLLAYDLRSVMIRRNKAKMLIDLPKLSEQVVDVRLSKGERKEYDLLERSFFKWWAEETGKTRVGTKVAKGAVLNKLHTLRRKAIAPKLKVIPGLVKEIKERGEKVVIATTYRDEAAFIRDSLPRTQVCYIDGSVSGDGRARAVEDFQEKDGKKFMIITEAGSQSLNLTAANNIINVNDPWTYADLQQRIDRVHRLGQEKEVNVLTLMTEGTIDAHIRALIDEKRKDFESIFDSTGAFLAYRSQEVEDIHDMLVRMRK